MNHSPIADTTLTPEQDRALDERLLLLRAGTEPLAVPAHLEEIGRAHV